MVKKEAKLFKKNLFLVSGKLIILFFLSLLPTKVKQELDVVENKFFETCFNTDNSRDLLSFEVEHDNKAKIEQIPIQISSQFLLPVNEFETCLVNQLGVQLDSQTADTQMQTVTPLTSNFDKPIAKLDKKFPKTDNLVDNKKAHMKNNKSHVLRNKKWY
jgi:hypothetical protein